MRTRTEMALVMEDIRKVVEVSEGRRLAIGLGDGSRYAATYLRPQLIAAGHPYLFEPVAVMDSQAAGNEIYPDKMLSPAEVDVWLIPRGTKPFSMTSPYYRMKVPPRVVPIFSPAFQERFHAEWMRVGYSNAYDFWIPRNRK